MADILMSVVTAAAAALIVFLPRNSMTIVNEFRPTGRALAWAVSITVVALLFLNSMITKDFLYIDF